MKEIYVSIEASGYVPLRTDKSKSQIEEMPKDEILSLIDWDNVLELVDERGLEFDEVHETEEQP